MNMRNDERSTEKRVNGMNDKFIALKKRKKSIEALENLQKQFV